MTRLEAAERAVVEAVLGLTGPQIEVLANHASHNGHSAHLRDTLAHLRDLRARAQEEECGALAGGMWVTAADGHAIGTPKSVTRCTLPRGHEGEHCGSLGDWRWT